MQLIDGKTLAEQIKKHVAEEVSLLPLQPHLGVILVGNDPASELYVRLKKESAERAGIAIDLRTFDAGVTDDELVNQIRAWNADPTIHAMLVQLPLPEDHDEARIMNAIDPMKDVDGFHPTHLDAWDHGSASIIPPVHEGVLRLIASTGITINTARISLIVNSDVFAKPLTHMFKTAGAFVHVMKSDAIDSHVLRESQIVITATGKPKSITSPMVAKDAVIIDVGTAKLPDGKTVGDVDIDSFSFTDARITPVPGGVGPMTIAQLLENVVQLCRAQCMTT